jgi:hypothetical protein
MKYLALSVLLIVGCVRAHPPSTILAHNQYASTFRAGSKARLQLTTTIIRRVSCSPDLFGLSLRLTFRNSGSEAVIIDKRSFWVRSLISTSVQAAGAKKYIDWSRGDMWGSLPFGPTDLSDFVILKPGEVYDFEKETRTSFMVSDDPANPFHRLRPGDYFLQIEVATWAYLDDARPFRQRWKDKGYLWSEGLTSEPMPFTIEQSRPIEKCT